jgi:SprT protein
LPDSVHLITIKAVMEFDFIKRLFSPAAKPPNIPRAPKRERHSQVSHIQEGPQLPDLGELIQTSKALVSGAGAVALSERLNIRWNPRMRSTAGMAYPQKALVTLNPRLATFGAGEIDRTLRHELAHLLAHERAGKRRIQPHGPEWRQACSDLGLPNEKATHDLPLPRRKTVRRFLYRCPSCNFELARVKPIRRAAACVKCCREHAGGQYDERFKFVPVK